MELIKLILGVNDFLEQSVIFQGFKFIVGIVVVVMAIDIVIILYILIVRDGYYTSFTLGHGIPDLVGTMKSRWSRVLRLIKSNNQKYQREAVIESGNMLYEILEKIGHEGSTLDEMLEKMVGPQLANIEDLKDASRVKNLIINDESYKLTEQVALTTVKAFGEALAEHETIKEVGL
jgi:hypothetical protein